MTVDLAETEALLARTPTLLRAWFTDLPSPWLEADEGPGTFSARDVLIHLIHGEQVNWMDRVRRILEDGDGVPFEAFDREGFQAEARAWSLEALLDKFEQVRRANLQSLRELVRTPDLGKRGLHPALGPVTLEQLLATWVVHDLGHVAQAARVMAKRHSEAVGPWKAYLPILTRR